MCSKYRPEDKVCVIRGDYHRPKMVCHFFTMKNGVAGCRLGNNAVEDHSMFKPVLNGVGELHSQPSLRMVGGSFFPCQVPVKETSSHHWTTGDEEHKAIPWYDTNGEWYLKHQETYITTRDIEEDELVGSGLINPDEEIPRQVKSLALGRQEIWRSITSHKLPKHKCAMAIWDGLETKPAWEDQELYTRNTSKDSWTYNKGRKIRVQGIYGSRPKYAVVKRFTARILRDNSWVFNAESQGKLLFLKRDTLSPIEKMEQTIALTGCRWRTAARLVIKARKGTWFNISEFLKLRNEPETVISQAKRLSLMDLKFPANKLPAILQAIRLKLVTTEVVWTNLINSNNWKLMKESSNFYLAQLNKLAIKAKLTAEILPCLAKARETWKAPMSTHRFPGWNRERIRHAEKIWATWPNLSVEECMRMLSFSAIDEDGYKYVPVAHRNVDPETLHQFHMWILDKTTKKPVRKGQVFDMFDDFSEEQGE